MSQQTTSYLGICSQPFAFEITDVFSDMEIFHANWIFLDTYYFEIRNSCFTPTELGDRTTTIYRYVTFPQ